jgi:hypothetical protein
LVAIASTMDLGTRCVTNSLRVSPEVLRLAETPASGIGSPRSTPGCMMLTMNMPSRSDTREALMNQPMVLSPMRPSAEPEPIWVMPTIRVEMTSGAMIILISRRKRSVTSEM